MHQHADQVDDEAYEDEESDDPGEDLERRKRHFKAMQMHLCFLDCDKTVLSFSYCMRVVRVRRWRIIRQTDRFATLLACSP